MTQKEYFEKLESFEKNNWEGYDEWFINNVNMEVVTEEKKGTVIRKGIKFKGRGKNFSMVLLKDVMVLSLVFVTMK